MLYVVSFIFYFFCRESSKEKYILRRKNDEEAEENETNVRYLMRNSIAVENGLYYCNKTNKLNKIQFKFTVTFVMFVRSFVQRHRVMREESGKPKCKYFTYLAIFHFEN